MPPVEVFETTPGRAGSQRAPRASAKPATLALLDSILDTPDLPLLLVGACWPQARADSFKLHL